LKTISTKLAPLVGWLIMVVIVAIGLFFIYSKKGISTYNAIVPSIGEKNNIMNVRVMNDNSTIKVFGDYIIKTSYGNITLKDKAMVNVIENYLSRDNVMENYLSRREIRFLRGIINLKEELLLREIYIDNFLSDTLQTSLSIFEYDKNTKLSSIGGLEFNISSFIIYNGRIDFIIEGSHIFIIDEAEIDIPITGAVLSVTNSEWILKDYASIDFLGMSSENNLILRIVGKDYSSGASSIFFGPEWASVKKIRGGNPWNYRDIDIDLLKSQLELNELIHGLIRGIRGEE
jgi:hypothetical protein